jgi:sulfatase modifying factor 1
MTRVGVAGLSNARRAALACGLRAPLPGVGGGLDAAGRDDPAENDALDRLPSVRYARGVEVPGTRRRCAVALAVAGAYALGCSAAASPLGAVQVVVDTPLRAGADFDELRLEVPEAGATATRSFRYAWDERTVRPIAVDVGGAFPVSLTIQNAAPSQRERVVSVSLWRAGVPVVARDLAFVVPPSGFHEVRVSLDALCAMRRNDPRVGVYLAGGSAHSCDADLTCAAGACVPIHVTPLEVSGERAGTPCRSLGACLGPPSEPVRTAQRVVPNADEGCSVDVGALYGEEPALVALEFPRGSGLAACAEATCHVPLAPAQGADAGGWRIENGRLRLPRRVCEERLPVVVKPAGDPLCPGTMRDSRACEEGGATETRDAGATTTSTGAPAVLETAPPGSLCRTLTPTKALCASLSTACGALEAADPLCDGRIRSVPCGPCTGDTSRMVRVEGGLFELGAPDALIASAILRPNCAPRVPTFVPSFYVDRLPMTVAEFEAWCASDKGIAAVCASPDTRKENCARRETPASAHPMDCLTWFEASAVCASRGARLLSEAEWEYAARRGRGDAFYPWGDAPDNGRRTCRTSGGLTSCPVGSRPEGATVDGLLDMVGNGAHWTSSLYAFRHDGERSASLRTYRARNNFRRSEAAPQQVYSSILVRCAQEVP